MAYFLYVIKIEHKVVFPALRAVVRIVFLRVASRQREAVEQALAIDFPPRLCPVVLTLVYACFVFVRVVCASFNPRREHHKVWRAELSLHLLDKLRKALFLLTAKEISVEVELEIDGGVRSRCITQEIQGVVQALFVYAKPVTEMPSSAVVSYLQIEKPHIVGYLLRYASLLALACCV